MLLFVERRPWDSNPQVFRPAVFKTASSPIRVTSVSYESKHRGQESNLRPSGSEPDATTNSCYPGSSNAKDRAMLALVRQARGRGFEPLSPDSKSGSLPLADPRISSLRVPCGNRTRLSSLEGWRLCRSANGTYFYCSGRSESRTRKAVSVLGRFRGGCHHQLACPSVNRFPSNHRSIRFNRLCISKRLQNEKAPVAGIEPALIRLTGGCLTVWPHRNVCSNAESGRSDLNRRSRGSGPRGIPDFPKLS